MSTDDVKPLESNLIKIPENIKPTAHDLTDDELAVIFDLFDYLRKARDSRDAKLDGLEPEKTTQNEANQLNKKVG